MAPAGAGGAPAWPGWASPARAAASRRRSLRACPRPAGGRPDCPWHARGGGSGTAPPRHRRRTGWARPAGRCRRRPGGRRRHQPAPGRGRSGSALAWARDLRHQPDSSGQEGDSHTAVRIRGTGWEAARGHPRDSAAAASRHGLRRAGSKSRIIQPRATDTTCVPWGTALAHSGTLARRRAAVVARARTTPRPDRSRWHDMGRAYSSLGATRAIVSGVGVCGLLACTLLIAAASTWRAARAPSPPVLSVPTTEAPAQPGAPVLSRDGVYVPSSLDPSRPIHVLLALHGQAGNGQRIAQRLQGCAEQHGWLLIAPTMVYRNYLDPDQVRQDAEQNLPWLHDLLTSLRSQVANPPLEP